MLYFCICLYKNIADQKRFKSISKYRLPLRPSFARKKKLGKTRLRPESMFYNKSQILKHLKLKFLWSNLMNSNSAELNRQPVTTSNCELKENIAGIYHEILIIVLGFELGRNLNQWLTLHRRGSNSLNSVTDPASYHTKGRL